jgi:hypothetical protein
MMQGLRTKPLRPLLLSALLPFLSACNPTVEKAVAPPPPQVNKLALEICSAWVRTEATWEDADTEATKDAIDRSIRTREAVCAGLAS